jgi:hypothetical protein
MKNSLMYLLEYLSVYGTGKTMGKAVDNLNVKSGKILKKQAKAKKGKSALKDIAGTLKRLRKRNV